MQRFANVSLIHSVPMGTTTDLRRALKAGYFPLLVERGFKIDLRSAPDGVAFRRTEGEHLQFISIQWEKHGRPRFKLAFGVASRNGTIAHGKPVQPSDVGTGNAPEYHCLYPRGDGNSTRHWFRQDHLLWQMVLKGRRLRPAEDVVAELQCLHRQVDAFFQTGVVGPNCSTMANTWAFNAEQSVATVAPGSAV